MLGRNSFRLRKRYLKLLATIPLVWRASRGGRWCPGKGPNAQKLLRSRKDAKRRPIRASDEVNPFPIAIGVAHAWSLKLLRSNDEVERRAACVSSASRAQHSEARSRRATAQTASLTADKTHKPPWGTNKKLLTEARAARADGCILPLLDASVPS